MISNIFYFHPYLGKIPMLTNIFSDGLKPPTTYQPDTSHRQKLKKVTHYSQLSRLLKHVLVFHRSCCQEWIRWIRILPSSLSKRKIDFFLVFCSVSVSLSLSNNCKYHGQMGVRWFWTLFPVISKAVFCNVEKVYKTQIITMKLLMWMTCIPWAENSIKFSPLREPPKWTQSEDANL